MKAVIKSLVQAGMRRLPLAAQRKVVSFLPRLASCFPPGQTFVFKKYMGHYRVNIDTTYPIEAAMAGNRYEPDLLCLIPSCVGPGDVCWDIGANVGAITLALAHSVKPNGMVLAIEPGPATYARLKANLALNPDLKRVIGPIQLGLSDKPGQLFWKEDMSNRGNAALTKDSGTPVEVLTVDKLAAQTSLNRLDFVKIDVEGMEHAVIRGGLVTWNRFKPILYFESERIFEGRKDVSGREEIESMLSRFGYKFFKLRVKRGNPLLSGSSDLLRNTLAIPETRALRDLDPRIVVE